MVYAVRGRGVSTWLAEHSPPSALVEKSGATRGDVFNVFLALCLVIFLLVKFFLLMDRNAYEIATS